MYFENLETRRLFSFVPQADLLTDANRDGVIDSLDQLNEDKIINGPHPSGALILPNFEVVRAG